ncbi:MAG: acyl-CoA synthetase FdrA [Ruminococcaceae bacterium]|nr:acyl-CoA synthetase FdrA [Oscillospiraceae bacterium]
MVIKNYIEKNRYYDSVFLMKIARKLSESDNVENASIGMGTPLNKETITDLGLNTEDLKNAGPNDLIIAIKAKDDASFDKAIEEFYRLVNEKTTASKNSYQSIPSAKNANPDANLAIISVAGKFAALEARRALMNDMNVFMFSDNVDIKDEVELKKLAIEKGKFMMGPGCGLSFINGVAIGLCSMVNRGDIGIVGASGSGIQEVMVLLHRNGFGISHAIGTGGRDLSDEVGGATMIQSIKALEEDEGTKIIALISKPPSKSAFIKVIDEIKKCKKKVVVHFLNGDNNLLKENGILYGETFDETANILMELSSGKKIEPKKIFEDELNIDEEIKKFKPGQKYLRAILCGGALTDETLIYWNKNGKDLYSNVALNDNLMLKDPFTSYKNSIIDIGDEAFTKGRAHVAIDPTARVNRFIKEARDKETSVIYLDFLLGYALHPDPASVMAKAITEEKERAKKEGRNLVVIATICGSDLDPQDFYKQAKILKDAGVILFDTNFIAAKNAFEIINKLEER